MFLNSRLTLSQVQDLFTIHRNTSNSKQAQKLQLNSKTNERKTANIAKMCKAPSLRTFSLDFCLWILECEPQKPHSKRLKNILNDREPSKAKAKAITSHPSQPPSQSFFRRRQNQHKSFWASQYANKPNQISNPQVPRTKILFTRLWPSQKSHHMRSHSHCVRVQHTSIEISSMQTHEPNFTENCCSQYITMTISLH